MNLVAIPQSDRSVTIVVSIYGHDDDSASKVPLTTAVALRQLRGTRHGVCVYARIGGNAPNQVITRFKFIRIKCDEGCDWCIYVTMVTCVDALSFTLCIQ